MYARSFVPHRTLPHQTDRRETEGDVIFGTCNGDRRQEKATAPTHRLQTALAPQLPLPRGKSCNAVPCVLHTSLTEQKPLPLLPSCMNERRRFLNTRPLCAWLLLTSKSIDVDTSRYVLSLSLFRLIRYRPRVPSRAAKVPRRTSQRSIFGTDGARQLRINALLVRRARVNQWVCVSSNTSLSRSRYQSSCSSSHGTSQSTYLPTDPLD